MEEQLKNAENSLSKNSAQSTKH
ncbi:hypothetical protein CCP3SC1_840012 [Gammaproteobacteria bacterium]